MPNTTSPPVLLYDGDCGFCSTSARWVERAVPSAAAIVPWQWVDLEAVGVTQAEVDDAVVLVDVRGRRTHGPEAIATLARISTSGPWRVVGAVVGTRTVLAVAWPVYRWVAGNRHRLPGGTPQCALLPGERSRPTRP